MVQKNFYRKQVRQSMRLRTQDELLAMSSQLMHQLELHPEFVKARVALLYHSLPDEPTTHELIKQYGLEKKVLLPVIEGNNLLLKFYSSDENLEVGKYNILEPSGESAFVNFDKIDFALIPGVAFDKKGHRLGRGKGYYDKLLSHPSFANVYKVGICFDFQLFENLPVEKHDVSVDEVLSCI